MNDVTLREPSQLPADGLTTQDLVGRLERIRKIMKEVMKSNVDYGLVPGCGDKPTLLKPGAETLLTAFQLAAVPDQDTIMDLGSADEVRYRVITPIQHIPSGKIVGHGVGECSSDEEKYKWRKAVCDQEWDEADPARRRNKWCRGYGGKPPYQVAQVRTNKADVANTVLKMAKKRSLVDGSLTSTGASRLFTQDAEDLPEEIRNQDSDNGTPAKPSVSFHPDTLYAGILKGYTPAIHVPKGQKGAKPQRVVVEVEGSELLIGGFNLPDGMTAETVQAAIGQIVQVSYAAQGNFKNLTHLAIKPAEDAPPSDMVIQYQDLIRSANTAASLAEVGNSFEEDITLTTDEKVGLRTMLQKKLSGLKKK